MMQDARCRMLHIGDCKKCSGVMNKLLHVTGCEFFPLPTGERVRVRGKAFWSFEFLICPSTWLRMVS